MLPLSEYVHSQHLPAYVDRAQGSAVPMIAIDAMNAMSRRDLSIPAMSGRLQHADLRPGEAAVFAMSYIDTISGLKIARAAVDAGQYTESEAMRPADTILRHHLALHAELTDPTNEIVFPQDSLDQVVDHIEYHFNYGPAEQIIYSILNEEDVEDDEDVAS